MSTWFGNYRGGMNKVCRINKAILKVERDQDADAGQSGKNIAGDKKF